MKEIKPLVLTNILCATAGMAFMPILGPIFRNLGLQDWHAGATVALGGVAWIYFARFWGKKSDSIGRKPILVTAVTGIAFSYLVLAVFIDKALLSPPAVAVSLIALVLTRTSISIFYAAIQPVSAAFVADKVEPRKRASYMARLGAANGFGMILGPVAGGMLAVYGLSTPLYTFAVLPFLAAAVLYFSLDRVKYRKPTSQEPFKIFDNRILLQLFTTFVAMFAFMSINACMSFLIMDVFAFDSTKTAQVTGYVLAVIGAFFIIAQIIVTKITEVKPHIWLILGFVSAIVGLTGIAFLNGFVVLYISALLLGCSLGFVFPSVMALTANSVGHHEQGAAAGTVDAAKGMGMIFGPLVSTALYQVEIALPFLLAGFFYVVLMIFSIKKYIK